MKKIIVNILLGVCALGLAYACFVSIQSDIVFDEEKASREQKVIARLLKIREAEEKYKFAHRGDYCGTIDSLVWWVKNERAIDKIIKEGELTDDQLEAGMTEAEAVQKGLIKRDTIWVSAAEILGIDNPDSLKYVPVGREGAVFQLRKKETFNLRSNEFDLLLEVRANIEDYMYGVPEKRIRSLKSGLKKLGKNRADLFEDNADQTKGEWYGLRVGDLEDPNNKLTGNWE